MNITLPKNLVFSMLLACIFVDAIASNAQVKTDDEALGQGLFRARGHECMFITPRHVVKDSDGIDLTARDKIIFFAEVEVEYEVDLAILRVQRQEACQGYEWDTADHLSDLLEKYQEGYLKKITGTGGTSQKKVRIKYFDERYIDIVPDKTGKTDVIQQGDSGSILYIEDQIVGMLLNIENNTGKVYRHDELNNTIKNFFDLSIRPLNNTIGYNLDYAFAEFKAIISKDKNHRFSSVLEKNTPILISVDATNNNAEFLMQLQDYRRNIVKQWTKLGGSNRKYVFTPNRDGQYQFSMTGTLNKSPFRITLSQITSDDKLRNRKKNHIVLEQEITGMIAMDAMAEYYLTGEKNSPVLIILDPLVNGARYNFEIIDRRRKVVFQQTELGDQHIEIPFTPLKTGRYIMRLTGIKYFSPYRFDVRQYTTHKALNRRSKRVVFNQRYEGRLAKGAMAEYRLAANRNSPLVISVETDKPFNYSLEILNRHRQNIQTWDNGNDSFNEFVFTPADTQTYTLRLSGVDDFGEYHLEISTLNKNERTTKQKIEFDEYQESLIAEGEKKEFLFKARKNSPFIITTEIIDKTVNYDIELIDPRNKVIKKWRDIGKKAKDIPFTPQLTGSYKMRILGTSAYGDFAFTISQFASNTELRNSHNKVKVNRSPIEGKIAEGATAVHLLDSYTNKQIILVVEPIGKDMLFRLELFKSTILSDNTVLKHWDNLGNTRKEISVQLPDPGLYGLRLIGKKHYGKYELSAVSKNY